MTELESILELSHWNDLWNGLLLMSIGKMQPIFNKNNDDGCCLWQYPNKAFVWMELLVLNHRPLHTFKWRGLWLNIENPNLKIFPPRAKNSYPCHRQHEFHKRICFCAHKVTQYDERNASPADGSEMNEITAKCRKPVRRWTDRTPKVHFAQDGLDKVICE